MIFPTLMPGLGLYAGRNYVQASGLPWGVGEDSFYLGASPAVAKEDFGVFPLITSPDSFVLTVDDAGVPVILSGGSTARQSAGVDVYDTSLRAWYGPVTEYVNNHAPALSGAPSYASSYTVNAPIDALDVSLYLTDPESDEMVVTTADALPTGLELVGNTVVGTPTVAGVTVVTFTVSDLIGASYGLAPWTFTVLSASTFAPRWVDYPRVRRFPAVRQTYNETAFDALVQTAYAEGAGWVRRLPGAGFAADGFGLEIDTYNIPNVPPLTIGGALATS